MGSAEAGASGWRAIGGWSRLAVLLGSVVLAAAACVPVRNLVADRDLVCRDVTDDVCIRVADVGLARLESELIQEERRIGRIPTIQVYPEPCNAAQLGVPVPGATRCWTVEATNVNGGIGVSVIQRADGSFGVP